MPELEAAGCKDLITHPLELLLAKRRLNVCEVLMDPNEFIPPFIQIKELKDKTKTKSKELIKSREEYFETDDGIKEFMNAWGKVKNDTIKADEVCHGRLLGCLPPELSEIKSTCKTTHSLWKAVKDLYLTETEANKIHLKDKFASLSLDSCESMIGLKSELWNISEELKMIGEVVEKQAILQKVVQQGLHHVDYVDICKHIMVLMSMTSPPSDVDVWRIIQGREEELLEVGAQSTRSTRESTSKNKKDIICFGCAKRNHYHRDCRSCVYPDKVPGVEEKL